MSKITRAAKDVPCIRCGNPNSTASHYNGPRQHAFGKGRGRKCSDIQSAEFCHKCDQEFIEGSTALRWEDKWHRSEEFLFWVGLTNIRRYEENRL